MITESFENVREAFSRQALIYDKYEAGNMSLSFMRNEVRDHVMKFLRKGDKILELNAGTGTDAVFFAKNGFKVHATDISDGMIEKLEEKIISNGLRDKITFQKCSFTELENIDGFPFDFIFSNFGGLNCASDLHQVTKYFPLLLKKTGRVTLVIMPHICPWEMALMLRGNFKTAFRRLKTEGIKSHIEGKYFNTYYFTPANVMEALGNSFKKIKLQGLASFSPPPYMDNFPKKYPSVFKILNKLDSAFASYFPFNHFADHFIITAEYL
jgi:ubiquinone/menaquinone biosynthesis C-methylase UbiE